MVAADLTVSNILDPARAARVVEQHAIDPSIPGLDEIIEALIRAPSSASPKTAYEHEVARAVRRVIADNLITLAATAPMPQVRAIATLKLRSLMFLANHPPASASDPDAAGTKAHFQLLADDIKRFLERPSQAATRLDPPEAPPGAPIGEPAMEFLRRLRELPCWEWER